VGAYAIEKIVAKLNGLLKKGENLRAEMGNLTLLLAYLYTFGVSHCLLIYDMIRLLVLKFGEVEVELLLLLLKHCGAKLKSDNPSALKEVVSLIQEQSEQVVKANGKEHNQRVQFMMDAILDLKKKRKRRENQIDDKIRRLKKWLVTIKTYKNHFGVTSLRISWKDLTDGALNRGRWWLVGSAWTNATVDQPSRKEKEIDHTKIDKKAEGESKLFSLAAQQRMNTSVRKSVFCIIMGASDFEDAFERLTRLELSGKQDREIMKVLVDCCGQEKAYNPYYALLAERFCEYESKYKFTLQLTFWDVFKQLETTSARRSANLARLLAHLIIKNRISIGILKVIEAEKLSSSGILFHKVLFYTIINDTDNETFVSVFKRVGHGAVENSFVCSTIAVLLNKFSVKMNDDWPDDKKKAYRKRLKIATKMLDGF